MGFSALGLTTSGTTPINTKARAETALSLLHDARQAVGGAHFPYDGHRALAMKEIDRAIKELRPPNPNPPGTQTQTQTQPHRHAQPLPPGDRLPAPVVQQTQAEADAKLREALALLGRARERISNPDAAEDVTAAIAELKAALALGHQ
jgi:hypothetical protein